MTRPLVIVGAGGFGREALDVVDAVNQSAPDPIFEVEGVLDDDPSEANLERLRARGIPFLGAVDAWIASARSATYLIGVGSPLTRARIDAKLLDAGWSAATVIHPLATVGSATTIGHGTVICAGVQVSTNVALGRHVHLNPNSTIGHDTRIGDYGSINPAATISGDVVIESAVLVGAGAVVLQGLRVGTQAVVGAAACVTRDVPPHAVVKGVPAR